MSPAADSDPGAAPKPAAARPGPPSKPAAARRRPPLLASLRGYRRSWLPGDLAAALALFVIAVPEQLATARLAGVPEIEGYYAFIAGAVAFALLGASRRLSVGADSTVAPLIAAGLAPLATTASMRYAELAAIMAVCAGVIVIMVWLLRLGWVAELLSEPIITGFLAGVACVIVIHQLPSLLGVAGPEGDNLRRLVQTLGHLGDAHAATTAIGLGTAATVIALERVGRRIPGALLAMAAATIVVAAGGLQQHGVAVIGTIAHGAPRLGLKGLSFSALAQVAPIAGVVALVIVIQSAATTRAFERSRGSAAQVGRDLLGVGAANVVAGLVGAFPVNASPPRTAAVRDAGGRSQAPALVAALVIAALVPAAGVLTDVPLAALAGVLVAVAVRLFNVDRLLAIARFSQVELALALITLLAVALVGVEQGIAVAAGLAILDRTRRQARPRVHVLGRVPHTTSWVPLTARDHPAQVPGFLVVLFATPLWYANSAHFADQLLTELARSAPPPHTVVLDAIGMNDIDFTGAEALEQVLDELDRRGVRFALARVGATAQHGLRAYGLLARIGEDHLFEDVDAAVTSS